MRVEDFESAVEAAETPEALWRVFSGYFHGSAVDRIVYLHLPPIGAPDSRSPVLKSKGFPEALVSRYLSERLYRDNPMLRFAAQDVDPVYWDEIKDRPLSEREQAFLALVRAEGLRHGVGIHVYGPTGRTGQCGLAFRDGVQRLQPAVLRDYQWVCQLAHLRYCTLIIPTLGPMPELSERETEVLAWVARGKSNSTIGDILGISAHTVDAHLRRIYLKLGVFDRISAAVRGIGVGLIRGES
jgi:DNA-binding CsgD family transcriptional regulator